MMTHRHRKHQACVKTVAEKLRSLGLQVEVQPWNKGFDLLVNDRVKVAIRVAYPHLMHRVTRSRGKEYEYYYSVYVFNFHARGHYNTTTDCFICIGMVGSSVQNTFIIPRHRLTGKTFCLQAMGRRYRGKYLPFQENWQTLTQQVTL